MLRIRGGQDYKAVESENASDYPVIGSGGRFTYATDYIYDGESVLLGRKGTIDKPLYVTGKFWTVDTMFYTEVLPGACGRYAYYAATTLPFSLYSTNTALPSMSQFDLANHMFALPPHDEQQKIAAFLDHETAKIDALIAEQQRLIELLKEKRQAVISRAVTKGLNPNAPMKDSGVEWLGEVPAHWKESRLGELVEFQQGKAHEPYIDDDGEHFCVNSRFVSTEGRSVKRSHLNLTPAKVGDVLMVMSDLPNGRALAKAYLVGDEHSYAVNQRVCRIRSRGCLPRFLFYLMDRHPQLLSENDGVNQTHLSNDSFKKLHLHMPPIVEQREIADYLFERSSMFAELLIESERSIFLLKERRSALISAAVTGKIDVRDWQPSKSASPEPVLQAAEEAASYG